MLLKKIIIFTVLQLAIFVKIFAQDSSTLYILFDSDKSKVPDSAQFLLIKKVFTQYPKQIIIFGHCDSIGSDAYNIALSKKRALAVKKILLNNSIADSNIKICMGFGENKPLALNSNNTQRQLNRRVEVLCIGSKQVQKNLAPVATKYDTIIKNKPKASNLIKPKDIVVGKNITLQNLFFIPGLHRLTEDSYAVLEELYNIMTSNPNLTIEIQGHVCCTYEGIFDGTDREFNTANLSYTRAQEVYNQMVLHGIDAKRMRYKGFGGSKKINEIEITEEDKAANRRVEILILSQ